MSESESELSQSETEEVPVRGHAPERRSAGGLRGQCPLPAKKPLSAAKLAALEIARQKALERNKARGALARAQKDAERVKKLADKTHAAAIRQKQAAQEAGIAPAETPAVAQAVALPAAPSSADYNALRSELGELRGLLASLTKPASATEPPAPAEPAPAPAKPTRVRRSKPTTSAPAPPRSDPVPGPTARIGQVRVVPPQPGACPPLSRMDRLRSLLAGV
jgi:hypothetical protein